MTGSRRPVPLGGFLEEPRRRAGVRHLVLHVVLRHRPGALHLLLLAHPADNSSAGARDGQLHDRADAVQEDPVQRRQDDDICQRVLRKVS